MVKEIVADNVEEVWLIITATHYASITQLVEYMTFNHAVRSPILRGRTTDRKVK